MGTESVFYYPVEIFQGTANGRSLAPLVDALALSAPKDSVAILSKTTGSSLQGLHVLDGMRWRFSLPMEVVSRCIIYGVILRVYKNLTQSVTLDATFQVYKNGQLSPTNVLEAGTSVYCVLVPSSLVPIPDDEQPDWYSYTALHPLSGHRVVRIAVGGVEYASSSDISDANMVLGITREASTNGRVRVQVFGELTEPSWNFVPGQPVFCGINGLLTQAMPASGFVAVVAFAVTPQTVIVSPKPPILLGDQ